MAANGERGDRGQGTGNGQCEHELIADQSQVGELGKFSQRNDQLVVKGIGL